ncbi:hypothetical protein [Desulfobacter curvatus]|uniref:hypothetical protein n=1 Tax=Desulfobacter curvatus TaxID=2290 RepID=UPI00037EC27D|nr:hypothetical protein [Desulfobacter curvatus]
MRKKLAISLFLIVSVFSSTVFAADKEKESITDLSPWKGNNASIVKLYDSDAGEKFFEKVTEHAPKGYTKEMVKDYIYDMHALKFKSLNVVDENTIIIDNKLTGDYVYVGSLSTKAGKYDVTWQIFKTDSEEMIQGGFKYFIFLPFHGHGEDSLRHAHFRYGNENFDYLATDPSVQSWWPTAYQPETTDEAKVMARMINKTAKLQAKMLPPLEKTINQ